MSEAMTLASLLGGQVSVEWYEAVALVREVAERLLEGPSSRLLVPELHQMRLSPEGRVDVIGGVPSDEPVRRMGQLLQALLAHSDAPVQLRLVISQATSPSPMYASTREYSEALAFFERPERSMVLQALAARASAASASPADEKKLTLDSIAPLPSGDAMMKKPTRKAARRSRARGWGGAAVAAVVVIGVGAGGVWYARTHRVGPQSRTDMTALANRASDAVGSAIVSGASAVTERLGLGRIVPANAVDPPAAPPEPVASPPKAQQTKRRDPPPADPIPPLVAFDLDPVPAAVETRPLPETRPAESTNPERAPVKDDTIYTVGSVGVVPPIGLRPQLARQLPPDLDLDHLGRIELIIGADGTVESARLLSRPRTVNDGMFLSVAKAWDFRPATKDGVPVRYRKTIWIASP
jgi:hypothetical protein